MNFRRIKRKLSCALGLHRYRTVNSTPDYIYKRCSRRGCSHVKVKPKKGGITGLLR